MIDYDDLMHDQAERRLKIVEYLIKAAPPYNGDDFGDMDIDSIIKDAAKLSHFIERGEAKLTPKSKKIDYPSYTKGPVKKKRKYTKRSKVWGKKK